jgi:chromosome segregation ATPase
MKTIEELEAELETVTRERDRSLFAWEAAGMQGRTAQSAMLELARQLEEAKGDLAFVLAEYANEQNEALTEDALCLKIAGLTHQRDRLREQVVTLNNNIETFQKETWRYKRERDEARAEVERLTRESATLNAMLDGRMPDTWREDIETLTHQLADATNESTHFQVMCKREGEEIERLTRQVERLTDERDELLVRVANQDAELRATREAYRDAYRRGAEAMREACIAWARAPDNDWEHLAHELENMPIPEEP